jgi:hypothetical protein
MDGYWTTDDRGWIMDKRVLLLRNKWNEYCSLQIGMNRAVVQVTGVSGGEKGASIIF